MHLLTPSSSSNLHKMIQNSFKLPVPTLYSLNTKKNVNIKAKGRSQPSLDVHMIIFGRLLKLVSLNDFHYLSTKTIDSLYQLCAHQNKKNQKRQQILTILLLLLLLFYYYNWYVLIFLQSNSLVTMAWNMSC